MFGINARQTKSPTLRWVGLFQKRELPPEGLCPFAVAVAAKQLSYTRRIGLERKLLDGVVALGARPAARAAIAVSRLMHHAVPLWLIVIRHYIYFDYFRPLLSRAKTSGGKPPNSPKHGLKSIWN
jgi:hypothetical protein